MAAALRLRVLRKRLVLLQLEGGEGRLNAHIARDPLCASERLPADLHQRRAALTPQFVKCVAERKLRRSLEDAACRQLGGAERKDRSELRPLARKLFHAVCTKHSRSTARQPPRRPCIARPHDARATSRPPPASHRRCLAVEGRASQAAPSV